ncbi:daunorubicin resistance protein DrrA family ABC transporter ATP-binding protein [Georgenia halophila]|uniref:Daunorubicin resistance protein DrrA family ABC transporter ATP-binding protein n=1 Tax=Georgenia halophila TaxID=620889 RepID=A0ABP8LGW0_9MICO
MTVPAIETSGLVKKFGSTRAVDGIDLVVEPGGVHGFLGPNGAGKTTTIRVLATLLRPDGGSARVLGHDVVSEADEVRGKVSLTGQFASVDEDLTGEENLVLLSRLLGFSRSGARGRAEELLAAFELSDAADRQVKKYSGGMRRRIDIAASILNPPELIFLDEPTTGLDPRSRNQVWDIVRAMVDAGTTVMLTTQYLEEADQLADRISVIDHGRIVAEGAPGRLKSEVGSGTLHVRFIERADVGRASELLTRVLDAEVETGSDPFALAARVTGAAEGAKALEAIGAAGIEVEKFSLGQPSLDEVFLALTGRPATEDPESTDDPADGEAA